MNKVFSAALISVLAISLFIFVVTNDSNLAAWGWGMYSGTRVVKFLKVLMKYLKKQQKSRINEELDNIAKRQFKTEKVN